MKEILPIVQDIIQHNFDPAEASSEDLKWNQLFQESQDLDLDQLIQLIDGTEDYNLRLIYLVALLDGGRFKPEGHPILKYLVKYKDELFRIRKITKEGQEKRELKN